MAATDGGGRVATTCEDVQVTMARPRRVLHFSDGAEEELEEERVPDLLSATSQDPVVNPSSLAWGPWLSHYTWKSGEKVVGVMDYMGEGLASFFGITTPKYQIEIDEHERLQEEKRQAEEESAGWVPKNTDGQIPLVMSAPTKVADRPSEV